jgi:hypothetical protein
MFKLKRAVLCQMMFLCFLVLVPFTAHAAGVISISRAGNGSFTVAANGFTAPAGFHVVVTYDTSRLSNPRVTLGSLLNGTMNAINPNSPGSVQIAGVSGAALKGSGPIATITFDASGSQAGALGVSGYVIGVAGNNLQTTFNGYSDVVGETSTASNSSSSDQNSTQNTNPTGNPVTTTSGGISTGTPVVGGTLTMPTDDFGARERSKDTPGPAAQPVPQEVRESAVPQPSVAEAAAPPEAPAAKKKAQDTPRPVQSVLEKFRLFSGEKTPKTLVALFDKDPGAPFSQSPAVCIADGKASVQVTVQKVSGEKAPNFGFNSAHYRSLKQSGDGEWLIEVTPDNGALSASISMLADGVQQEFPLTVSPSADVNLNKSGSVSEADFQLFLKTRGTDGAPKFDLNGDGKRDYLDDYIFTANYLVAKGAKNAKEAPAQKKAQ